MKAMETPPTDHSPIPGEDRLTRALGCALPPRIAAGSMPASPRERPLAGFHGLLLLGLVSLIPGLFAAEDKTANQEAMERRQRVELMSFFLQDPDKAVVPKTTLSIQLYNQAVEQYQANRYDLARELLRDSMKQDDANAFAYELMGDIDAAEQKLTEAKSNYEIAYNLRPKESLKDKIKKLMEETKVEKKLSTYQEEHFIIKYYNQEERLEGFELRELLRKTYLNISRDFAFYFNQKTVVLLYEEEDFRKITEAPHWVGGLYDGKVRMPIKKGAFNQLDLDALTAHEVTHAFVAFMSAGRAPAWINEGLAEYEENKVKPVDLLVFNSAVKTKTLLPIDQLMSPQGMASIQDPLRIALFYQQSYHLVNYLVDRYKMFLVKQMLTAYGKGKNSDEVIREVVKISPRHLEKEWKVSFA